MYKEPEYLISRHFSVLPCYNTANFFFLLSRKSGLKLPQWRCLEQACVLWQSTGFCMFLEVDLPAMISWLQVPWTQLKFITLIQIHGQKLATWLPVVVKEVLLYYEIEALRQQKKHFENAGSHLLQITLVFGYRTLSVFCEFGRKMTKEFFLKEFEWKVIVKYILN